MYREGPIRSTPVSAHRLCESHCDADLRALELAALAFDEFLRIKGDTMSRFLLAISFVLAASAALAQSGRQDPGCARDVSRFCRAHMDEGDQIILMCLKQNRARLSKTCAKVLTDHGQ